MWSVEPSRSKWGRVGSSWPGWTVVVLLALLGVLATLQYRWLGRAGLADRQRTAVSLQSAASRFALDLNRELGDLTMSVVPLLPHASAEHRPQLMERLDGWRQRSDWPTLLSGVWIVEIEVSGDSATPGSFYRVDEEGIVAEEPPDGWRAEIAELAAAMSDWPQGPGRRERGWFGGGPPRRPSADDAEDRRDDPARGLDVGPPGVSILAAEMPAIVLPIFEQPFFRRTRDGNGSRRFDESTGRARGRGPTLERLVVLGLDQATLVGGMLPAFADRHFAGTDLGPGPGRSARLGLRVVWTVSGSDAEPIWSQDLDDFDAEALAAPPVAQAEIFGPLPPPREAGRDLLRDEAFGNLRAVLTHLAGADRGRWRLEVLHPAGSLDAAVASARRRGMAVSLGILGILAVSVVLLAQSLRRTQDLARRQLEFVAGVTHELKTPIAALRSAGQNLADGVIEDPERVARYGRLVDAEGRRLEDTVAQILAFAGMERGRELRLKSLDAEAEARRAVDALAPLLEEQGIEVEWRVAEGLPAVRADREALATALRNLLTNAARHGQAGSRPGWIGVEIDRVEVSSKVSATTDDAGSVLFRIRDRGPGVPRAERRRIFEPFVRGQGLAASNVPGSGLGLALVRQIAERLGGKVWIDDTVWIDDAVWIDESEGQGTAFVLEIPADEDSTR